MEQKSFFDQNNYDAQETSVGVGDLWLLIKINFNKIITITLLVLFYSAFLSFSTTPDYNASATIMIKEKSSAAFVMNFGGMQNSNQIINEMNLIKSRSVAEKVVDYLWKNEEKMTFIYLDLGFINLEVKELEIFLKNFLHLVSMILKKIIQKVFLVCIPKSN